MTISRKLMNTRPSQPPMRYTRVSLEDGRWITFYGEWLDDETAMNRAADELEAPEL
jgi:hypothetical protein